MEPKDFITGAGLIIVIAGWLFSRWKDRNHEVFKERLRKRMEMHDAVIAAALPFLNPVDGKVVLGKEELDGLLSAARTRVNLYGYSDEIDGFECFIRNLLAEDVAGVTAALATLMPLIIKKMRKDLGYRSDGR